MHTSLGGLKIRILPILICEFLLSFSLYIYYFCLLTTSLLIIVQINCRQKFLFLSWCHRFNFSISFYVIFQAAPTALYYVQNQTFSPFKNILLSFLTFWLLSSFSISFNLLIPVSFSRSHIQLILPTCVADTFFSSSLMAAIASYHPNFSLRSFSFDTAQHKSIPFVGHPSWSQK